MKRLHTTLAVLTGLFGSVGAVWDDAESDLGKDYPATKAGELVGVVSQGY